LFPTATIRREVSREVAVPIPAGPNLGEETNNGGTAKLFRKAHLVEIWDGNVRQLGGFGSCLDANRRYGGRAARSGDHQVKHYQKLDMVANGR
jgi:hypothetical protein